MTKLFQFLQGHQKPAFSEKVRRGDQGKFLKNHPNSSPRLKTLKALAQMALSSNLNALKVEKLKKILAQSAAQKFPNGQVMVLFARSPKTRIF